MLTVEKFLSLISGRKKSLERPEEIAGEFGQKTEFARILSLPHSFVLIDCFAFAVGRSLVLRSLAYLILLIRALFWAFERRCL
jgi:hypothetical protein